MSSGFVKTSVLEVAGNFHGEETRVESEDVKRQEFRASQAANRPLYEQLEDEKEKKEAEYDAVTKMMFAPTKALDEEEAQHMNDVEDAKRTSRELLRMQESHDLDGFKLARLNRTLVPDVPAATSDAVGGSDVGVKVAIALPKKIAPIETKLNIKLKKKRKVVDSTKSKKSQKKRSGR
mmetsp:Transcript_41569/g.70655  ORF Transcript_41569/g.70655 Transcript_41569/m.70655 type:complete len:178 (+) Transcript_41569:94-627(+)